MICKLYLSEEGWKTEGGIVVRDFKLIKKIDDETILAQVKEDIATKEENIKLREENIKLRNKVNELVDVINKVHSLTVERV